MREVSYTVADHVAEMETAGVFFKWSPEGLWQNMLDIDWDAFDACRARAVAASITTNDVWQHLKTISGNEVA